MYLTTISLIIISYCVGSVCSAIIVAKAMGLADPRQQGSNNPGATNMLRIGGKKAAAITLTADAIKGLLPVLVGRALDLDDLSLLLIALASVIGHIFPIWFAFKGGKGVATSIGALFALTWPVASGLVLTWLIVAKVFRISSLSAIIAFALAPFYCYWLSPQFTWGILFLSVLVIVRHHENIQRLISGDED